MEKNTWLIALAVIAIVAIVAVFGMTNITGYAIKERVPRTCEMFANECLLSEVYGSQNCQKCCALNFACNIQLGRIIESETQTFNHCMNGCNVGGGKDSCARITDCPTCWDTTGCCWSGTECFTPESGMLCMYVPCDIPIIRE